MLLMSDIAKSSRVQPGPDSALVQVELLSSRVLTQPTPSKYAIYLIIVGLTSTFFILYVIDE